jgi:hypothetical protein
MVTLYMTQMLGSAIYIGGGVGFILLLVILVLLLRR